MMTVIRISLATCVLGLSLASTSVLSAHEPDNTPRAVGPAETYAPSPVPDRIVLSFAGDPATSAAVTWRTSTDITTAQAQIAVAEPGPGFADKAETLEAQTEALTTDINEAHFHSVRFDDLEPKTAYAYRVGDGVNWSEWFQFRTASDQAEPFSFLYFGDAQNAIKSFWSRVIREAHADAPRAAFLLHAGDLVNRAEADGEWGEWFYAGGWLHGTVPVVATPGNHEYTRDSEGNRRVSHHWRPTFTFPEHGPEGLEETVYYVDYQDARIISLNSMQDQEQQVAWLEGVLEDNPNTWTIITHHYPIYSSARGRDNSALRALWQPIYDRFAVDLVLTGHDHTYARSKLISGQSDDINVGTGVATRSPEAGTVYVVSVSGPKMYNVERTELMARAAEDTQLYQVITIDGDTLSYKAHTALGEIYDGFELRKQGRGEPNLLIEQIPDVPERLRTREAADEKQD